MAAPQENKVIPAFYIRPEIFFDQQDQVIFQQMRNGIEPYATFVPFDDFDALAERIFLKNIVSRPWVGSVVGKTLLREAALEGTTRNDSNRAGYEIFVDSGCIHGAKPDMLVQLIQRDHPDRVFISDLVGSQGFSEETKRIYYNKLMNSIRNKLLPQHPEYVKDESLHTDEFLHQNISGDPQKQYTPKDGFKELVRYVLSTNSNDSVALQMDSWDDDQIALWIWYFAHPDQYHGQWMSTLDKETRQLISDEVEHDVEALVKEIETNKNDTETIYYEGNWDSKVTMQNVSDGNNIGRQVIEGITQRIISKKEVIRQSAIPFTDNRPHDPLDKGFDYPAILRRNGNQLISSLETNETSNCFHVIGPYFALISLSQDDRRYQLLVHNALEAKKKGKIVVLHMHGVPNKELLFLDKYPHAVGDNKIIENNIHLMMLDTQAQVLIHPHEHDPKRYEDGTIMSPNNDIVYNVRRDRFQRMHHGIKSGVLYELLGRFIKQTAGVEVDFRNIGHGDQTISVYSPKQPALSVTDIGPETNKDLFSGTSLPPKVLFAPEPV